MSEEKRFIMFLILTMLIVVLTPQLFQWVGLGPAPRQVPAPNQQVKAPAEDDAKADDPEENVAAEPAPAKTADQPDADEPLAMPALDPALHVKEPPLESRTLGSSDPASGYRMKVLLSNRGATVGQIELAEFQNEMRTGPLQLLNTRVDEEGSLSLGLKGLEWSLANRHWNIVPVEPVSETARDRDLVCFQTALPEQGLVITKTFGLKKASYTLELEINIKNASEKKSKVAYRLGGPRGLVLEGAWYATKTREVAIANAVGTRLTRQVYPADLVKGAKKILDLADSNGTIARANWAPRPIEWFERFDRNRDHRLSGEEVDDAATHLASSERFMESPVRLAGVDGQFFCALLIVPIPATPQDRWDAETLPVLRLTPEELIELKRKGKLEHPERCDVSVEIASRNFDLAPGEALNHTFTVYGGPRRESTVEQALADPAIVSAVMNFQSALFIFPASLVSVTATTMLTVLEFFHGLVGNWGVAIIMLTVLVRLLMFPLSRKQALAAVKMQALKPELDALREKHKSDKEKLSRAQMELWRKHKVNPLGGCLPLIIQMPIFIGLWQGLQSSVDLRQARFLWIDNLAAPDGPSVKFFNWGEQIPIISWLFGPYFNLLPAILIGLFLVQQKMFMPPKSATPDPQVEMQQKMMTYMLVFFGYIFWRLPSGLCLYYIASTAWGIAERMLLPKLQHADAQATTGTGKKSDDGGDRKSRGPDRDDRGNGRETRDKRAAARTPSFAERLQERLQELLKKADKR
jgi:YidC/Oxa1 family membrane protein insertase